MAAPLHCRVLCLYQGEYKFFRLQEERGTVNHRKSREQTWSPRPPSVFITGLMHTAKLPVSARPRNLGTDEEHPAEAEEIRMYVFISGPNTLFKIRLGPNTTQGPKDGGGEKFLKIRYGCQHPRNCSPEPMMDKGRCAFEE